MPENYTISGNLFCVVCKLKEQAKKHAENTLRDKFCRKLELLCELLNYAN